MLVTPKSSHQLIETIENSRTLGNTPGDSSSTAYPMLFYTDPEISGSLCKSITTRNISSEDKLISGTYYHPDLIPYIACWMLESCGFKAFL